MKLVYQFWCELKFSTLEYVLRNGISLNVLRECQIVFQSGFTVLHSYCWTHLWRLVVWTCVYSLGFSTYKMMSSANRDSFASSFPIWMTFITLPCQIFLAKTSSTMLNRSGMKRYPVLFLTLGGMLLAFAIENDVFHGCLLLGRGSSLLIAC